MNRLLAAVPLPRPSCNDNVVDVTPFLSTSLLSHVTLTLELVSALVAETLDK